MKRVLKWVGYIAAGFVVVVLVAVGTVYAITSTRMSKKYSMDLERAGDPLRGGT